VPARLVSPDDLLCCVALVRTKMDASVRRGAVVYSLAFCSYHRFLYSFKPLMMLALDDYFKNPRSETLTSLFSMLSTLPLDSKLPLLSLSRADILLLRAYRLRWANRSTNTNVDCIEDPAGSADSAAGTRRMYHCSQTTHHARCCCFGVCKQFIGQ
jgi:hypothetical protein